MTTTVTDSDGPMRIPVSSPSSHRHRTFFDEVTPDLPKVTHPLEYARMAYKVLYREYEEALRAREFLLDICSHAENQLEQLDVIISLKKKDVQLRSKGVSSGAGLRDCLEQVNPSDGMDEAP
jgi:trehalose-6-phosphatase